MTIEPEFNFDVPQATLLRDEGMERASNRTEREDAGWRDRAFAMLTQYDPQSGFMAEDFREWAYAHGLPKPASERAWGAVYTRAARELIIVHVGYDITKTPGQHRCPGRIWKKTKGGF